MVVRRARNNVKKECRCTKYYNGSQVRLSDGSYVLDANASLTKVINSRDITMYGFVVHCTLTANIFLVFH
jgi:hypothetical protein